MSSFSSETPVISLSGVSRVFRAERCGAVKATRQLIALRDELSEEARRTPPKTLPRAKSLASLSSAARNAKQLEVADESTPERVIAFLLRREKQRRRQLRGNTPEGFWDLEFSGDADAAPAAVSKTKKMT